MNDDILINKASIIERCLKRVREEYDNNELEFKTNFTKQDSIILNIQRACEASIDMANRVIRIKKLGIPQSTRDVFVILEQSSIITEDLSKKLQAMVGFRNIAVHDYKSLNLDIVKSIVENNLDDFSKFSSILLKLD